MIDPYYNITEDIKFWSCHSLVGYLLGNGKIKVTGVINDLCHANESKVEQNYHQSQTD